jgi:[CysO sulfur-carrier protein]-thiocarboxylate-dependent cysteine synthase
MLTKRPVAAPARSILDTIGNTPLVELQQFSPKAEVRIFAKLEGQNPTGSVKDRIALKMVEEGERTGQLSKEKVLVEPTSGNTGISLAMVCKLKGYRFLAVMPDNVSEERRQLMRAYGAEIVLTEGSKGSNGSIEKAQELVNGNPEYQMLYQYGNSANALAHYETTAPEILEALPEITHFVAGLGTSGTLMGVSRRLKDYDPSIQVIAAEPFLDDLVFGLRSLEAGFIPPIFDASLLDRKINVPSDRSIQFTQELLWREGIFAGVSSGAALSVAVRVGQGIERGNIVVLFADGGWKYLSTDLWSKPVDEAADALSNQLLW